MNPKNKVPHHKIIEKGELSSNSSVRMEGVLRSCNMIHMLVKDLKEHIN